MSSIMRSGRAVIAAVGLGVLAVPAMAPLEAYARTSAHAVHVYMQQGKTGAGVREVQRRLRKYGFYSGRINGKFDSRTRKAVMAFQRRHGLWVDGIVGRRTWKALGKSSGKTRRQLRQLKAGRKMRSFGRGRRGRLMAVLNRVKPKGLPLRLAAAVVTVESNWRVNATGAAGERGLMQLMPATARNFGARGNLYNPATNLRVGTKYLHYCYKRARGNIAATIGCYNRGPGRMWQWSGNPITRRYVAKVRRLVGRRA